LGKKTREKGDNLHERVWFAQAALNLQPGQHIDGYSGRLPARFAPGSPGEIREPSIHQIMICSGAFQPEEIHGEMLAL